MRTQTGADVLFVMNYPGYVGEIADDDQYHLGHPGLGYKYTSDQVLTNFVKNLQICPFIHASAPSERNEMESFVQVFKSLKDETDLYKKFLKRYGSKAPNDKMKAAMTDIAFEMTRKVWLDLPAESRGRCFFCIGGVNAINPFSASAVKNEIAVYADIMPDGAARISPEEGSFYDFDGQKLDRPLNLSGYDEIYMDFNGSMAFFGNDWKKRLELVASKVCDSDHSSRVHISMDCLMYT